MAAARYENSSGGALTRKREEVGIVPSGRARILSAGDGSRPARAGFLFAIVREIPHKVEGRTAIWRDLTSTSPPVTPPSPALYFCSSFVVASCSSPTRLGPTKTPLYNKNPPNSSSTPLPC